MKKLAFVLAAIGTVLGMRCIRKQLTQDFQDVLFVGSGAEEDGHSTVPKSLTSGDFLATYGTGHI